MYLCLGCFVILNKKREYSAQTSWCTVSFSEQQVWLDCESYSLCIEAVDM